MWVTESVAGRLQLARVSLRGYARTIRNLYRNRVGVARLSFFRWPIGFGCKHVPGFDMIKLTPDGTVAAGTFADPAISGKRGPRSEEHTPELQSLMEHIRFRLLLDKKKS